MVRVLLKANFFVITASKILIRSTIYTKTNFTDFGVGMDSIKVVLICLILGFLLTSVAAPISPDKLIDGTRLRWNNVTSVQNERYSENGSQWYTYKITIEGSKPANSASKKTIIEKNELLNFRWKMDSIVDNAKLIFKVGASEQRSCNATNWEDDLASIQVGLGDEIQWNFMNLNPNENVQAWIAIAPEGKRAIEIPTPSIPETPSGPDRGYTNQPCSFSTNSLDSSEDIDYQFEFDGNPSNLTEEAKDTKIWASPGQKRVRAKAINKQGKASNWSKPKPVVIFEQINVTDHLQDTINNHTSYAELVLLNDQIDVDEMTISEKNNITIISSNGNKFKLAGSVVKNRVRIVNSNNISIQKTIILNPGGEGIKLDNSHYCTISNNEIEFGKGKAGISISGNNNNIKENILENVSGKCSGYSEGISLEKGENNKIADNIIKRQNNCLINSYLLNTSGPFEIGVSNLPEFPIQLYIGYMDPKCICVWNRNGKINCAPTNHPENKFTLVEASEENPSVLDRIVWSTLQGSDQQ
jgi:hypothetical protein